MSPVLAVREILEATGGHLLQGRLDDFSCGVSTDSRSVSQGNLFVALKGPNFDGHAFIRAAVQAGASGLLMERESPAQQSRGCFIVQVDDTLRGLGDLARHWRRRFAAPVVAITGSCGKTTTKEMLASIVGRTRRILKTEGNYNNLIGLPLTLFGMTEGHQAAILEMGTNRPGEIARLTEVALPDVGLLTNIGEAHLEGLPSIDIIRQEKGDLFRVMAGRGTAIFNADDPEVHKISARWRGRCITFGIKNVAEIMGLDIRPEGHRGVDFTLQIGGEHRRLRMAISGRHHIYNALAATAGATALRVDHEEIQRGLSAFRPVSGRMVIRALANGALLIDDTYNANPSSVREALYALQSLKGNHRSLVVLGDMLELGDKAKEMHEEIGHIIAQTGVARMFLTGDFAEATAAGALINGMNESQITFYENPDEITGPIGETLGEGDCILVKGSRRMRMETVVQKIFDTFGIEEEP